MRKPIEVFPGFYNIPGFPNHAMSPEEIVVNRETKKEAQRCVLSGYVHYTIKDSFGKKRLRGRARLMMIAFKFPGAIFKFLEVNHIDGNKRNDRLDNLEWVTQKENRDHADRLGLARYCVPISVRDVDTGEVKKYPSSSECAREFGVSKDAIAYRINNGEHRVYPERKQYRKGHHDSPWVVYNDVEWNIKQFGTSKHVLIKFVLSGKILEFSQIQHAAEHLKVPYTTVSSWLRKPGQPVLPGYIQLKFAHDLSPWRQVNDAYLELADFSGTRPVKVTNVITGDVEIFSSGVECAEKCGILTTTLNYRLQCSRKTIFSDNCQYEYYSTSVNSNGPVIQ